MFELELYRTALISGVVMMLSFSAHLLLTINPKSEIYSGYCIAQRVFGAILFVWALYLAGHVLFNLRFTNNYLATTVSLSSYFLFAHGFEMVLHTLLDNRYFSWRRVGQIVIYTTIFNLALVANYLLVPDILRDKTILIFSVPLFIKMCLAAYKAHRRYLEVKRNLDNYYSDNTSDSVVWMRNCIYIMLALGFSSSLIPYGTAYSDAVAMAAAIAVITYAIISLRNYLISLAQVQKRINELLDAEQQGQPHAKLSTIKASRMQKILDEWVQTRRFLSAGITIEELAEDISSNRTYISDYLNNNMNQTFKNWIGELRIEYSKTLLLQYPDYPAAKIAEMVGYARSSYNKSFAKLVGQSPNNWRKDRL